MTLQFKPSTFVCLTLAALTINACSSTTPQAASLPDSSQSPTLSSEQANENKPGDPQNAAANIDDQLKDAYDLHDAGKFDLAAAKFLEVASSPSDLSGFLYLQAANSTLQESQNIEILQQTLASGAFQQGYPGSEFLLAKIESILNTSKSVSPLPSTQTAENALKNAQGEEVCNWLLPLLVTESTKDSKNIATNFNELADHAFAYCLDDTHSETVSKLAKKPSNYAHQRRAEGYFSRVRFRDANQQIEAINTSKLSKADRCDLDYLTARTVVRLRRINDSNNSYQQVIDKCTDSSNQGARIRSMYALGRYFHDKNQLDESQKMFETMLTEYPTFSHADDALFYLARIERKRGNTQKQHALLARALRDYPDGDMTHEMVWEVHESLIRTKKYQEFIDAITQLELPEYDNQYFSQGRLEYFLALASSKLNNKNDALTHWQNAWNKYPFSFYGYLSNLRLRENNTQVAPLLESLQTDEQARQQALQVSWFDDESWQVTGTQKLAKIQQFDAACDFETVRLRAVKSTDTDKWRLAHLCDAAKRYPLSHNIVRRQIPGSPWAHPQNGVLVRWQLAWPNPFEAKIAAAHTAEAAQWDGPTVHRAFSTSIMREESSFIEDVTSWAGALGLMQLMPKTALDHDRDIDGRATPDRLKTADVNIRVGVDHIFSLAKRFNSHPVLMAAAYNAGGGRISGWLKTQPNDDIALWVEDIPYLETRDYTKRVIGSYAAYQWLLGQIELDTRPAAPARL